MRSGQPERAEPEISSMVEGQTGKLPWSDYTNALTFVRDHGENIRYCDPWKKWTPWKGTHWQVDNSGAIARMAKQTVRRLARQVEHIDDEIEARALLKHIKKSLSNASLQAMVACAQSEEDIQVQPEEFDRDPWLLNCANGTVDLRTGELRPHNRGDLVTRCTSTPYDLGAESPTWDAFLARVMGDNQNLMQFLQRAIGYSLTGVIREHVLVILWGSGRNGKSTFLNVLRLLLESYAMKAPSELLMASNNDRHPTERADLYGKRLVCAIETEEGRRLAEVFVKEATGGDPIRARRMREDFWEFNPTHKVFLATNHKPVIKGTDAAIWERIRLVPFNVTIPEEERDTELPDKLLKELPGILTWAVRGCLEWQKYGLSAPDEVLTATDGYRTEMDVLGQFLDECCITGSDHYRARAAELYERYKNWCGGDDVMKQKAFGMTMTERGYKRTRGHNGVHQYVGIGLVDTKSSAGDQSHTNPSPEEDIEKKEDTGASDSRVTNGDPNDGINSLQIPREDQTRKLGSPLVTLTAGKPVSHSNTNTSSGDQSHSDRSPSDDDIAFAVGHPKYATPATQCAVCGSTSGTCSHARRKR